jgi:cysteine desulfurase/selenocysteine lyase
MDFESIRKDFPILKKDSLVYLDSAATSLTPEPVLEAMNEYYRTYRANIHRGLYKEAERASKEYEEAREAVERFIGAGSYEIIFTAGATDSSNKLFYSLEQSGLLKEGDEIVTTVMDHHAVLLPLQALVKRKKLILHYIPLETTTTLDYCQAEKLITNKTKIVALTLASNVLGTINDVARVARRAHDVGALVVVDATAGVGHIPVDVQLLGADFLFFSGHKMCGPTGVGVLYGKKSELAKIEPCFLGGGIVEEVTQTNFVLTEGVMRFEAGTPNIAGVIGLTVAVEYVERLGLGIIQRHCQKLVTYAQEKMSEIEGVTVFSAKPDINVGIVSFVLDTVHPHDVAEIAGKHGVGLRAGHHCALPLHTELKVPATTRASIYMYSTKEDIDALVSGIVEAKKIFNF